MRRAIGYVLILLLASRLLAQEAPVEEITEPPQEPVNIEELRRSVFKEDPNELMGYSIGDTDVSLMVTGTWYGELQGNFGFYNSPLLGTGFASPETPFLFKQEVDLTMALWINQRWFVEASFLDDSSQNTYRAGYQGLSGEFIQYAGIGNTGLDFPSFPYLDLGGDSPSSFGFYGRAGNDKINVHTLIRYDAASSDERIFTGGRERTYSDIAVQNTIRGISFVLPDTNIDTEIIVYIEDDKGTLRDTSGRRWRLALNSEYAASRTLGFVELGIIPGGMIAVAYGSRNYNVSGFLNDVQDWFNNAGSSIDLSNYPQCGVWSGSTIPGVVEIGAVNALVVYEPGTFSPYEKRSLYSAPSSNSENAALICFSSGKEISGYSLVHLENTSIENSPLFPAEPGSFASGTRHRNVYEIIRSDFLDPRDPKNRFPLAQETPEIYLPGSSRNSGDIGLRFTNYNSVSGYFIGTDVIPGSVQVWRSGIMDSRFTYNAGSGEVVINGPVGHNEIIRITYLKTNEAIQFGSIAAGVGVIYKNNNNPFSAQAAVGIRWNLTDDAFTQESQSSAGAVGISAKTAWDYDYLNAQITAGFAFVQTDTTGLYRAAGMEGNEIILALPFERSFISNKCYLQLDNNNLNESSRADLIYRNYYNNNIMGDTLMSIDWSGNKIVTGADKPYPVKDSSLGNTQVLTAEFTLDSNANWTGFQVPLGANGDVISRASEIEIPFRLYGFSGNTDKLKIIIQIGSLSGMDFSYNENDNLIWEKEIFSEGEVYNENARIVPFKINEAERQKLSDAKYLRLIIINNDTGTVSGRVLLAPPIVRGSAFRAIIKDGNTISAITDSVTVTETKETGPNTLASSYSGIIDRLHSVNETQRVLKIEWEGLSAAGVYPGADGRISELPLSNYRELSFFVKGPVPQNTDGFLHFIAARGQDSISSPHLEAKIPLDKLSEEKWKKVTIRYNGENTGIKIDGVSIASDPPKYNRTKSLNENETSYIVFFTETNSLSSNGKMYIDEIILEDPIMIYRMNAGTAVEYKREGILVSIAGYPVIENFSVSTAIESEGNAESETSNTSLTGSLVNRTGMAVSLFNTDISGNLSFTAADETFLWDADHSISKKIGAFSVKEVFYASPQINAAQHTVNMAFNSAFFAGFNADAQYDLSRLRQEWNLNTGYNPGNVYIPAILIRADAVWTKKERINENDNYGDIWLMSWKPLVPDAGNDAFARRTNSQIVMTQRTRPVGAVLSLDGFTNYIDSNSVLRLENSAFLDIPVVFNKLQLNFRMGRNFKRQHFYLSEDAIDDSSMFFKSINESSPLWKVFPGYSLFAPELNDAMDEIETAQYTGFNDHFSARVNLPNNYNLTSFFIPSRVSFRIERILEQKMDVNTDTLNLGGSMSFSAINMFGAMGYRPLFKIYQSDEFSHSVETSVIIPKSEEIIWGINLNLSASFRGFSGGILNYVNTLAVRSNDYWTESFTLNWEIPTQKNLLSVFYNWMLSGAENRRWLHLSKVLNSDYEQLRKLSMELVYDKSSDYPRWSIMAGHEEIVRIIGRLNFTTFIKLRFSEDLYTEVFIIDAMIGTSLRLSF